MTMTKRANTKLELRPLEAHELDTVNGAGIPVHSQAAARGGAVFLVQDLVTYGWDGAATTVSKPIQSLAGSGPSQVDIITWPK